MTIRATHTYVELEAPPAPYDFVVAKMIEAEYGHVFDGGVTPEAGKDCGPIDMQGLALTRGEAAVSAPADCCRTGDLAAALIEIALLKASINYDAQRAAAECQEQRERRLALEAEIPFIDRPFGPQGMPIQFVERQTPRTMAGFFGRLGDRFDFLLGNA
jgi:hypothetical protein